MQKGFIAFFFLMVLAGCHTEPPPVVSEAVEESTVIVDTAVVITSCDQLTERKSFDDFVTEALENRNEEWQIWTLSDVVDTNDFLVMKGHFTDSKTTTTLALLGGSSGMSSGSADNLLMLFDCTDVPRIIFAMQTGEIDTSSITDFDGDGVLDMIITSGTVYMGGCYEFYKIVSFKNAQEKVLYSASPASFIECGWEFTHFKKGDTIQMDISSKIIRYNNQYAVDESDTVLLYNGGKGDDEMRDKAIRLYSRDTFIIGKEIHLGPNLM